MKANTESAGRALAAGGAVTLIILLLWLAIDGVDALGFTSFMLRWLHVVAAILWLGMIWFVNFIQFSALQEADDVGRRTLMTSVVPRVAHSFRHASHLTLVTGVLLLFTSGYLLDATVFSSAVYMPPARSLLMWFGVLGGLAMWAFVHFVIWPNLRIVIGQVPGDQAAKDAARAQIKTFARLNLALSVPVTFAMVAAPHLY